MSGTPLSLGAFPRARSRPAVAAVGAAALIAVLAPVLPPRPGAARLLASLAVFVAAFLAAWLAAPGGSGAAREFVVDVRELKPQSDT